LLACSQGAEKAQQLPVGSQSLKSVYVFMQKDTCISKFVPSSMARHRFDDWQVDVVKPSGDLKEDKASFLSFHARNPKLMLVDLPFYSSVVQGLRLPVSGETRVVLMSEKFDPKLKVDQAVVDLAEVKLLSSSLCGSENSLKESCVEFKREDCTEGFESISLGGAQALVANVTINWPAFFESTENFISPLQLSFSSAMLKVSLSPRLNATQRKGAEEALRSFMLKQLGN